MSARDIAQVAWRWRAWPRQAVDDFRYHRQFRDQPTSFLHRFLEQQKLLWSNRVRAVDYYELGLYDPAMPAGAKRRYIGQFRTRQLLNVINAEEFHRQTDEKLQFDALAKQANLPVPEILAVVAKSRDAGGYPLIASMEELRAWLADNAAADIVLKPVEGLKGWGVLSLGAPSAPGAGWRRLPLGEPIDIAAIWAHCESYLNQGGMVLQRCLKPHPVLADFAPDVLHTVRANTYLKPEPRILDAILRVGGGRTPTDNVSQGGIAVPLDLATGRCGRGSVVVGGMPQFVDHHPVSGARITDVVLPDWQGVCALAMAAAQTFSRQTTIGWDIGLTSEGPVLLEGNWSYGLRANQLANRCGVLDTPWREVCNNEGGYRFVSLGFRNKPR